MAMEDRQDKVLCVDFWLRPYYGERIWPPTKGQFELDDGLALQRAAAWCNVSLGKFILTAIRDHLLEVQAAMEEERIGES